MRVLITGSRDWQRPQAVTNALDDLLNSHTADPLVVVHGACHTGADRIAQDWARRHAVRDEPHPAEWTRYGRRAGPLRNQAMVDLGADVCLAFPTALSRGTRDCMQRAVAAGIRIINLGDPSIT